jgi:hypothetical protein
MEYEYHYTHFASLKAYIDRIGAEQLNFRRFMVKEYHGSHYYMEKVLIRICDDFTIDCRNKDGKVVEEYLPTEEEAAAIIDELKKIEFPHSIRASVAQVEELLETGQIKGSLYSFFNSARTEVIMCQERIEKEDGTKDYVPWTLFMARGDSPTWRRMEPGGALPFWKPKYRRNKASIMVHEGAKTAHFVDALVNDPERREERKKHPWIEQLTMFEHWGAIGGALAIHRCDYEELRRENIQGDLYYVSDNDFVGKEAVKTFSRKWGGTLFNIKFDERFKVGWDLADPIPEALISKAGTVEMMLLDYTYPVTWATQPLDKTRGRPGYGLTPAFSKEWVHTVNPEYWCHCRLTQHCFEREKDFNSHVRPFSDVDDTGRYLKQNWANKATTVKYDPASKPGLFHADKNLYLNLYEPSSVRDYTAREAKHIDYTPFEDFLATVFPSELERGHVARWAATLIGKPGLKMNYGLLLISEMQGVGKTTFTDILCKVLGDQNTAQPNEATVMGRFTEWAQKQLVVVNEIYQGHSAAAYNRLKEIITDKKARIEKKFVNEYYIDNHVHIIACSNSMKALKLDNTDRRWFVPTVSEAKPPHEYWIKLHSWLAHEDGYRKVKLWAQHYVRDHGYVAPGSEAPWTRTKTQMIEESDSVGQDLIRQNLVFIKETCENNGKGDVDYVEKSTSPEMARLLQAAKAGLPIVVFDSDGIRAIAEVLNVRVSDRFEKPLDVRRIAKAEDLFVGKARITRPAPGFKRLLGARVISTSKELAGRDPNEITAGGYDAPDMCLINLSKLAAELQSL